MEHPQRTHAENLIEEGLLPKALLHPIETPEAFYHFLNDLSQTTATSNFLFSPQRIFHILEHKAQALQLNPANLLEHLWQGLLQEGALGADEMAEYSRNLRRLFPNWEATGVLRPTYLELYEGFLHLGRHLARILMSTVPLDPTSKVVFLGTDAEFQKPAYDLLHGSTQKAGCFYLSRRALMTDDELRILQATRNEVFGVSGISRKTATGAVVNRDYTWMDNSLMSSLLFQIITHAKAQLAQPSNRTAPFETIFIRIFADEIENQSLQRERQKQCWLTFFGNSHPQVDAIINANIQQNLFTQTCLEIVRKFYRAYLRQERHITIVDIGATGSQPCLIWGAVNALTAINLKDRALVRQLSITNEDLTILQDLQQAKRNLSVLLYAANTSNWGFPSQVFRFKKTTAAFAMAVESIKTVKTNYHPSSDPLMLTCPSQQLLAYMKHLVFRNAALEHRSSHLD